MSLDQRGDVLLFVGVLNVDIIAPVEALAFTVNVQAGVVEMTPAFETALALSFFGGNLDDDGTPGNPKAYWGNLTENDEARKQISRTQFLLKSIPATSGNLRLIEEAALADVAWFLETGIADTITVAASIPALNRVTLSGRIEAQGNESQFTFTENWKASV